MTHGLWCTFRPFVIVSARGRNVIFILLFLDTLHSHRRFPIPILKSSISQTLLPLTLSEVTHQSTRRVLSVDTLSPVLGLRFSTHRVRLFATTVPGLTRSLVLGPCLPPTKPTSLLPSSHPDTPPIRTSGPVRPGKTQGRGGTNGFIQRT